ncbi:MAG: Zn-ribbon domain-containing OB-fold protein [Candidatus Krumholzibacteria bacterium]|nr:Zn-ribbon domain-containing OB-fold protein [Candidatus Krumholzibacteria bacterium]
MKLEDFELGGTNLKSSDFKQGTVLTTEWEPDLKYAWDNGVAIGRYLAELKEGRIIARACHSCKRIMLPPRMFCELCFRPTDEWFYVQDTGTVNTFSIARVNWDASRRGPDEPALLPAVIEIDGASKGMGILHMLGEVEPEEIRIGMKVRAVWKKPGERTGAITDILYFKPIAPARHTPPAKASAGAKKKVKTKARSKAGAARGKR